MIREVIVGENGGIRIDRYLSDICPELSRSYIQKLLKCDRVSVNEKIVKSNYKVSEGERISFDVPDAVEPEILPEEMKLEIL